MHNEIDILLQQKNKRILFAGVGNVLKSDDGAGVYISRRIKERGNISALTVETGIENHIGKINSLNPEILVIIDCIHIGEPAGTIKLLTPGQIRDFTFNTHNISLKRLSEFFRMPVFFLGIQPEKIDFGENISYFVKNNADRLIRKINKKEVHHGRGISV